MEFVNNLDSAKIAGLLVIGSVLILSALRKGFGGVSVRVGD
ncbi:hypothetical protein ACFV4G_39660 [Kitasatospora sp. NPDC059747]